LKTTTDDGADEVLMTGFAQKLSSESLKMIKIHVKQVVKPLDSTLELIRGLQKELKIVNFLLDNTYCRIDEINE
jgi:hypothetical protein